MDGALFLMFIPFVLFLFIPIISSLNILISFKQKKDLFVSFYLFSFFLLLCQLVNFWVIADSSILFFSNPFRLVFLILFLVLNISFYFIHKPSKFKLIDYLLLANLLVISFLPYLFNLFGFDIELFFQQFINIIVTNIFLIYFHYLVMSLKGDKIFGSLLNSRFVLKIILYTYHSILFSAVFLLFNNYFIAIIVSNYIIISFTVSSIIFLLDLFIKYFSIDLNKGVQSSSLETVDGYSKSHLSNVDLEKLEIDLDLVMNNDKIFKDTMLTLKKLASCVGVSSHQLSEYLNNNKNVSFSQYLMTFRVEEAKVLLIKYDWRTTMSIGYEVGFNSHSSFGRCFKLVTGESPGAFRSKLEK